MTFSQSTSTWVSRQLVYVTVGARARLYGRKELYSSTILLLVLRVFSELSWSEVDSRQSPDFSTIFDRVDIRRSRDYAYFGNTHILQLLDYAYFLNMHIRYQHDYAYFRNMHILECFDYAYHRICIFRRISTINMCVCDQESR
jgi:hypothetical protein